jgi:type I restriction enzyme, R subunit
LQQPDADEFDLIAHIGFDSPLHSREERVTALRNIHREFFAAFDEDAREVMLTLVEKYRYGGLSQVTDPAIFRLAPFNTTVRQVAESFGSFDALRLAIDELVRRIYLAEAAQLR